MICRLLMIAILLLPLPGLAADRAVSGLRFVSDRWPDAGSPEAFGRDAIRLADARTSEEEAIAVWRFIQQMTVVGKVPKEPAYENYYVLSPEKLLNVYGVHWCDGLSRLMTRTWRALGRRADKLYKFGHTLADIHYRDGDGVERWHVFDLSQHWFVYDRTGTHIATKEELSLDHSLLYYPSRTPVPDAPSPLQPSWVHAGHLRSRPHSMGIDLGMNDRIEFMFGNEGKPYMNLFPPGDKHDFEHGPYPLTFGNGRLRTRPEPDALANGEVLPIRLPYVIAEAFLDIAGRLETPDAFFRVSLSVDGGNSWHTVARAEPRDDGRFRMAALGFCPRFDPEKTRKIDQVTPFGRYEYLLRVEMNACRLEDFEVTTVFQHNLFALPILHPGTNRLSFEGALTSGAALKVTYRWDDSRGKGRTREEILAGLPGELSIQAEGDAWQDVRGRSLGFEVLPRTGLPPAPGMSPAPCLPSRPAEPAFPIMRSIGGTFARTPEFTQDTAALKRALEQKNGALIGDRVLALGALRDPRSADLLKRVVIEDTTYPARNKILASQALYHCIGREAAPFLMRILEKDDAIRWDSPHGKWSADAMWLHTAAMAAAILAEIRDFAAREETADLIAATLNGQGTRSSLGEIYRGKEIAWGLLRDLGRLGSRRHVPLLKSYLAGQSDAAAVAAEALVRIGDPQVLVEFITLAEDAEYPPVRLAAIRGIGAFGGPEQAALLLSFLDHWDEDLRAAAAQSLGALQARDTLPHLEAALRRETFPWVREIMAESVARLQ